MSCEEPGAHASRLGAQYLAAATDIMARIQTDQPPAIGQAATVLADRIARDELVYIYGPGGHSNLAAQEVFFRAGGLMHVSAILDEGTLLSSGARRSMAMERLAGYGRVVLAAQGLGAGDVLVLVNAYGINAALVDAALWAREMGVHTVGISSRAHAQGTAPDHPARHPSKANLHDLVDIHIDSHVPIGDAVIAVPGIEEPMGALSTFAAAFTLGTLAMTTAAVLHDRGVDPPVWRSGNAPGGDAANARFIERFAGRVRWL